MADDRRTTRWHGSPFVRAVYALRVLRGLLMVHYRAQKVGLQPDRLLPVYLVAAVGGLVGARLLYAFAVEPSKLLSDPLSLFSASGFAFYGGVSVAASRSAVRARPRFPHVGVGGHRRTCGGDRVGHWPPWMPLAGCCHGAIAPVETPSALFAGGFSGGEVWLLDAFLWRPFSGASAGCTMSRCTPLRCGPRRWGLDGAARWLGSGGAVSSTGRSRRSL